MWNLSCFERRPIPIHLPGETALARSRADRSCCHQSVFTRPAIAGHQRAGQVSGGGGAPTTTSRSLWGFSLTYGVREAPFERGSRWDGLPVPVVFGGLPGHGGRGTVGHGEFWNESGRRLWRRCSGDRGHLAVNAQSNPSSGSSRPGSNRTRQRSDSKAWRQNEGSWFASMARRLA